MIVILSGVAGSGKDTIKKEIINRVENVESLPSYTSRSKREGDVEGETYNFVTREQFEEMIKNKEFYEYDIHHNEYYGTSRNLLNNKINNGKIIIKDIDVNGTQNLIDLLGNDTKIVTIFLRVPKEELRFDYEESKISLYDYVIKNNDLEKTVKIIMTIIENEINLENAEF